MEFNTALWIRAQHYAARILGVETVQDIYEGLLDISGGPIVPNVQSADLSLSALSDDDMSLVRERVAAQALQIHHFDQVFDAWIRDGAYFWGFYRGRNIVAVNIGFRMSPDTWLAIQHSIIDSTVPVDDLALVAKIEWVLGQAGIRRILQSVGPGVKPRDRWIMLYEGPLGDCIYEKRLFRSGSNAMHLREPLTAGHGWMTHEGNLLTRELTPDDHDAGIALITTATAGCRLDGHEAERLWRRWINAATIVGTFADVNRLLSIRVMERQHDGAVRVRMQANVEDFGTRSNRRSVLGFVAWLRAVRVDRILVIQNRGSIGNPAHSSLEDRYSTAQGIMELTTDEIERHARRVIG